LEHGGFCFASKRRRRGRRGRRRTRRRRRRTRRRRRRTRRRKRRIRRRRRTIRRRRRRRRRKRTRKTRRRRRWREEEESKFQKYFPQFGLHPERRVQRQTEDNCNAFLRVGFVFVLLVDYCL